MFFDKETVGKEESRVFIRKAEDMPPDACASWKRSSTFGKFKSFIRGQSSGFLFSSDQSSCFDPMADLPQGPALCVCTSFSQDGFQCKGLWGSYHNLLWSGVPSLLTPEEPFCAHAVEVSLTPSMRNMWPLDLLPKQCLAHLCPCHYCYLKVSTGDQVQRFTLSLLYFYLEV